MKVAFEFRPMVAAVAGCIEASLVIAWNRGLTPPLSRRRNISAPDLHQSEQTRRARDQEDQVTGRPQRRRLMMARPYQAEHNRGQKDQHERRNPQPHAVPDSIDVRHDGSSRPFSVLACPRARRRASWITRRRFAHLLSGDQAGLYGERGGAINNGNRLIRATAAFGTGNILRLALVLHNSRAVQGNVARSASHANTAGRQKRASEQQIRAQPSASARTPRWTLGQLSSAHAFPPPRPRRSRRSQ